MTSLFVVEKVFNAPDVAQLLHDLTDSSVCGRFGVKRYCYCPAACDGKLHIGSTQKPGIIEHFIESDCCHRICRVITPIALVAPRVPANACHGFTSSRRTNLCTAQVLYTK